MNLSIGLGIALALAIMFGGYEHYSFKEYRMRVEAEAAKQQVITENVNKWNNQVTKETNDAYQKRLAAINTKYGRLHQYSDSNPMPTTNPATNPQGIAAKTPDNVSLERDCAVTTNMLVSLQDIIKRSE